MCSAVNADDACCHHSIFMVGFVICLEWTPAVQRCHCITFSDDATRVLEQSKKLSLLLPTGWWHCISTGRHHIISAGCTYMTSCVCACWVYTIKPHSDCNVRAARVILCSFWLVSPFWTMPHLFEQHLFVRFFLNYYLFPQLQMKRDKFEVLIGSKLCFIFL